MSPGPSDSTVRVAGAPSDIPEGNIAQLFLEAVDTHQKNDALKYKIVSGNTEGIFTLNESSGVLKLTKNALDADDRIYALEVTAEAQHGATSE